MVAMYGGINPQAGMGMMGKATEESLSNRSSMERGSEGAPERSQSKCYNPFKPFDLHTTGYHRPDTFGLCGNSVRPFPGLPYPPHLRPFPCPCPPPSRPPLCDITPKPEQPPGLCGPTVVRTGWGNDTVNVHQYSDGRVDVTVNGETTRYSAEEAKGLIIDTGSGNDSVTVTGEPPASGEGITIRAGAGNDTIIGGAGADKIDGGAGNDNIRSRGGDDVINAGGGNDVVYAGAGNDVIRGGSGRDVIHAGAGNDTVFGGAGNDTIKAGAGNDTVHGGAGNDRIYLGAGNDTGYGNQGNDLILGGRGNDTLNGGKGWDQMYGGAGHDTIEDRDLSLWQRIRGAKATPW